MIRKKNIQKYINTYAEHEVRCLNFDSFNKTYDNVIVIPAYNEEHDFIERLECHPQAKQTLLILVVNQPDSIVENTANIKILRSLKNQNSIQLSEHIFIHKNSTLDILVVDKTSKKTRINKDYGVGLARKVGCDIAVELILKGIIKNSWIYSTDADTHLPNNYFEPPTNIDTTTLSAMVFDYSHLITPDAIGKATAIYEQCIKYYTQQLHNAGSPYGFATLGSCLAVDADHYCHVRGFPKKPAGEDFYLLNKLAKIGTVTSRTDIQIKIISRTSDRVPFGTGPAVQKIAHQLNTGGEPHYYNPNIFKELTLLLTAFKFGIGKLNSENFHNESSIAENINKIVSGTSQATQDALTEINFGKFIRHCQKQARSQKSLHLYFHEWFDAFKTLKFLHALEKSHYPSIRVFEIFKNETY